MRESPTGRGSRRCSRPLGRLKAALPDEVALIGFCGAPWTVASYMIAGRGTPDQAPARLFAYRHPELFAALIDRLVDASAAYLVRQIAAGARGGADFRFLGGRAAAGGVRALVRRADRALVAKVRRRAPDAPVIAFPRGAATAARQFAVIEGRRRRSASTPRSSRHAAAAALPARRRLQGNLDPLALLAGGAALDEGIDRVLTGFAGRAHIFNLGHGILPETPIAHVERLVARARRG